MYTRTHTPHIHTHHTTPHIHIHIHHTYLTGLVDDPRHRCRAQTHRFSNQYHSHCKINGLHTNGLHVSIILYIITYLSVVPLAYWYMVLMELEVVTKPARHGSCYFYYKLHVVWVEIVKK